MGSTGYAEKTIIFRGASMKNLKKKVHFRIKLKSKHLLVIMSIFCVSCIPVLKMRKLFSAVLLPLFHPA